MKIEPLKEKTFYRPVTHKILTYDDDIWYICYLQLGCHPVAVVQYTFTHKQHTERHKTNNT